MDNKIKLFEGNQIRSIWDIEREEWYFSIVDIVGVLTESENPRKYWSVLKTRLKKEGNELATICSQLQAVDKCRNCMSQQPILMRKSAKNVII